MVRAMRDRLRAARATGVAGAVVAPGALAHAAAGGALDLAPTALACVVVAAAAFAADRVRWTFPRLVLAAAAGQPVLHVLFSAGHAPVSSPGHGGHAEHAGHTALAVAGVEGRMVAAHLAVTLVVAVALRWGLRWLSTLPTIGRALVVPRRGTPVPRVVRVRFAPPAPPLRRDLAVLAVRGSRGPPR